MNERDRNRELVLHGGRGNRNTIEAPLNYVKSEVIPRQQINNSLEAQITMLLSKKANYKNFDVFHLNGIFGLRHEVEGVPKKAAGKSLLQGLSQVEAKAYKKK